MGNPNAKPPKKRKATAYSRKIRGGNSKRSSFDYAGVRDLYGLDSDTNPQQVGFAIAPSSTNTRANPSPVKHVVKARLAEQVHQNALLSLDFDKAQKNVTLKSQQIFSLKQQNRDLSRALQVEKKKSRETIAHLLADAERIMSDACDVELEAGRKMSAAEYQLSMERERLNCTKQSVDMKISLEKEKSKHNMQEERRRSAARLAAGMLFCIRVRVAQPSHICIVTYMYLTFFIIRFFYPFYSESELQRTSAEAAIKT